MSNIVIVIPDEIFAMTGLEKLWNKCGMSKEWLFGRGSSGMCWETFYSKNISGRVRDDVTDIPLR